MDYDDSDFQSQNFQLGGEDSTKFPPGLRSYALPKFDLDESLQVHLRYDALVETEVLLGIQNQEGSRWIEDFSRENSGIEFSSSATESCSIARRNNVWSEATSSESVEMLLKSVGQDEMLTKQTIIEDSDFCDGLDNLHNQMDPSLNQDDFIALKTGDILKSNPTLPPEKCLENISNLSMDATGNPPQIEASTCEDGKSGHECLVDLDPIPVNEKFECHINSAAEQVGLDQKAAPSSPGDHTEENGHVSAASGFAGGNLDVNFESMRVDSTATSMQSIVVGATDGCRETVCSEKPGVLLQDGAEEKEIQLLRTDAQKDDQQHGAFVVGSDNVETLSGSSLKLESLVHITEQSNEVLLAKADSPQMESGVLSKDNELGVHFAGRTLGESFITKEMEKTSSATTSKDVLGSPCSSLVKIDSSVLITHRSSDAFIHEKPEDLSEGDSFRVERVVSVNDSGIDDQVTERRLETTLSVAEETQSFQCRSTENSNSDLGHSSSVVYSVTSMIHQTDENVEMKDGLNKVGVHGTVVASQDLEPSLVENDGSNPDATSIVLGDVLLDQAHYKCELLGVDSTRPHLSYPQHAKSSQKCDDNSLNAGSSDGHTAHSVIPVLEKEGASLSIQSENIEMKIDDPLLRKKIAEVSSPFQNTTTITAELHSSPSKLTVGDESEPTGDILLASGKKLDATTSVAVDVPDEEVDEKEETVPGVIAEKCFPTPNESCKSQTSSGTPASDSGQHTEYNSAAELPEMLTQSSSPEKSFHSIHQSEPEASKAVEANQECGKELEGHHTIYASDATEMDGSELFGNSSQKGKATASQITGETASNAEILTQSIPSSVDESSNDIGQNKQQGGDADIVSGVANDVNVLILKTEGDVPNGVEQSTIKPACLSDATEVGNGSPTSVEPKCDSPTVISCTMPSQSENECQDGGEKGSLGQNNPVSDDLPLITSDIDLHADNVKSTSRDSKDTEACEDDRSFTFVVGSPADMSERATGKGWQPFSNLQPSDIPQTGEESPTTPGLSQANSVILKETSHGSHKASDEQKVRRGTKGKSKDRSKLPSDSSTERGTAAGGKPSKEASRPKQTVEKGGNPPSSSAYSNKTTNRVMQVEEMRSSSTRLSSVPAIQASSLPDLNTSASSPVLCQQPFTDLQQVQLRAQIFVYGSLIQGTPPDEACMISAFGDASRDGGRSMWENVWRISVERFHSQKSPLSNLESPMHPRSGVRVPEQVSRCTLLQNKAPSSQPSRTGSKGVPTAIVNPTASIPSSVWSFSTPCRDVLPSSSMPRGPLLDSHPSISPLHSYQSPHARPYLGNNSSWLPQVSPGSAPWSVSPRNPGIIGPHYSALPIAEAIQAASVRDPPPRPSSMQLACPIPLPPAGGPLNVPSGTAAQVEPSRTNVAKIVSADQKPRKRKKSYASEDLAQISAVTSAQIETVSSAVVSKHLITSLGIPSPAQPTSIVTASAPVSTAAPIASSTHNLIVGGGDKGQNVILSEEMCSKIEQAKLHAADAAALAAAAVRHSEGIWNQLVAHKNSGLVSEVEGKLASAAVAAAAAASVAKAAAAAAKVATDAALQAKLMADEALIVPPTGIPFRVPETTLVDGAKNAGNVTPLGLRGKDKTTSSGSIIVATREAARKRVEAASAATKQAENLDAVVKAAELAVEAVSQAGTVIAMGDPIPLTLSELIEAGPGGYWKANKFPIEHSVKENSIHGRELLDKEGAVKGPGMSVQHSNGRASNTKETLQPRDEGSTPSKKLFRQPVENEARMVNGKLEDSIARDKGLGEVEGRKTSDCTKTVGVISDLLDGSTAASSDVQNNVDGRHQQMGTSNVNSIKEGSVVEVVRDEDSFRGVWFSAKVLNVKDGKVHVCYSELLQDEGADHVEWIPLEGEGDRAPRIRIPHPMTAMKSGAMRKRPRAAIGKYVWSIGDRVDALMRDGWREGIVTEKSKEDETKVTIHFPAKGDTSTVRAWNLRPSLIWKDGQWKEWSRENNFSPHEGDTPQGKRQKLGRLEVVIGPEIKAGGKNTLSNDPSAGDSRKHEEPGALPLSAKDKVFTFGKNIREENKAVTLRVKRTGLQMEGSRVIFGVPKPGKKRKFMDVSKHYTEDKSAKISEGTDSIKFAKYLVPQGTLGWKNSSKVENNKGRREAADFKPKVSKPGRSQGIPSKKFSEKESSAISSTSASSNGNIPDHLKNTKPFVIHEHSSLEALNLKTGEGPQSSSSAPVSDVPSSKKKSSSAPEGDTGARKKLAKNVEKGSSRNNDPGKLIPDAAEPRRSNRKMQPTSRLLEGLQNSLIGTKIPSLSRGKGVKSSQQRSNNHG